MSALRLSVDIGGTFTDCVVESEGGIGLFKAPTTPDDPTLGVIDVVRKAAGDESVEAFLGRVERFVHGTTLATNVLHTRSGACTGLLTTAGFRDVIEMRRGVRNVGSSMFDQFKPPYDPLVPRSRRRGVPERTAYTGEIEQALDEAATEDAVRALMADGCEAIAIAFLHAYANPVNELRAREVVARCAHDAYVVCSHETLPMLGEFERFSTTVVSAFIGPSVSTYLHRLEARLAEHGFGSRLLIMLSSGLMQTVDQCHARPAELLVSGPAAAPFAALSVARERGHENVLEVDMGGTSFEVCVIRDGIVPTTKEAWIGQERVATKMVDVASIGAGGGSIAWIDTLGLLRVGPHSAAADPGPAAYGRSVLPTVTDADLLLGYLPADFFLGGEVTLDLERARAAVASVADPLGFGVDEAAAAIFDTVTAAMADAVTEVCTKKGHDVRAFALVAGGGAGGVHGAAIAERLGIPEVLFPVSAPVLSAMGMLTVEIGQELTRAGVWDRLAVGAEEINAAFRELETAERETFGRMGIDAREVRFRRSLAMRYQGQFHEILVDVPGRDLDADARAMLDTRFHERYLALYRYSLPWRAVELLECHLRGSAPAGARAAAGVDLASGGEGTEPARTRHCLVGGGWREVPVWRREALRLGDAFAGPALIDSSASTIFVPETFSARVDGAANVVLQPDSGERAAMRRPASEAIAS